jgi:translation initiation factor 2 beta subunit (eIF-2beta)/eIF-5
MHTEINTRQLSRKILYTECIHCDSPIEKGLYDELDNTMYLDCSSCKEESTVWDWYDEEGSHND